MIFERTPIEGLWVITPEPYRDDRGFFSRVWCRETYRCQGIEMDVIQSNYSYTAGAGIIRGLHYQEPPAAEKKLVQCVAGRVFDVAVDVRPGSPTCGQHYGRELSAREGAMMLIPQGMAHGCQSLEAGTALLYHVSAPYSPDQERGLRFDDPALGISWPLPASGVTEKDLSWPLFRA